MAARQILATATAYFRARRRASRLRDCASLEAYQTRQLARLMDDAARHLPFYAGYSDRPFADWPVLDKPALLADFAALNRPGLSIDALREAIERDQWRLAGHAIGRSTGTSGNRGYYVISDRERFTWLGTILAKALPGGLWRRRRVALALPTVSELYRSADSGSRIALRMFDLAQGPEAWAEDFARFDPDTVVAPPRVLRWLAERGLLAVENAFSAAEVLDPLDRAAIERATGRPLREIYMATEGLFGVSCPRGTLHLAEDVVHFEFERPDPASPLVTPIVTDFTRRSQAMIRYRMNDLLELATEPCPCGSPYRAVRRIEGRSDDVFLLPAADGARVMVTPDVLRNAVVDSDPAIDDFRIVQIGINTIRLAVSGGSAVAVQAALMDHFARRGLSPEVMIAAIETEPPERKLRRVRREWQG